MFNWNLTITILQRITTSAENTLADSESSGVLLRHDLNLVLHTIITTICYYIQKNDSTTNSNYLISMLHGLIGGFNVLLRCNVWDWNVIR